MNQVLQKRTTTIKRMIKNTNKIQIRVKTSLYVKKYIYKMKSKQYKTENSVKRDKR